MLTKPILDLGERIIEEISGLRKGIQDIHDENSKRPLQPTPIITLNAELKESSVQQDENRSRDNRHLFVQWVTAVGTLLAFGAAAFYAHVASQQLNTMNKQLVQMQKTTEAATKAADAATEQSKIAYDQFVLQRQQTVGTMGAVIEVTNSITNDPLTHEDIFAITFQNVGHVLTPEARADIEIRTERMSDFKVLKKTKETLDAHQIAPKGGWSRNFKIADYLQDFQREKDYLKQSNTITVQGTFWFDDGFGHKHRQPLCFSYIGSYSNIKTSENGILSGGGGFMNCVEFERLVSYTKKTNQK